MKRPLLGLAILACLFVPLMYVAPAMAQTVAADGKVVIPWGDFLSASAATLVTLACSALALALARLPAPLVASIKTWHVDQLLERAITYGINMTAEAAKGQSLSLPVANKVIEQALDYAIANGSASLIKWMGGKEAIEGKIIARLDVAPEVGVRAEK